jgi:preprotein translocase YajC subunit
MLQLLVVVGLIAAVWYLLIVRPQRQQADRHESTVGRLAVGVHVMTVGGIYGRVQAIEGSTVVVELAPGLVTRVAADGIARIVHDAEAPLPYAPALQPELAPAPVAQHAPMAAPAPPAPVTQPTAPAHNAGFPAPTLGHPHPQAHVAVPAQSHPAPQFQWQQNPAAPAHGHAPALGQPLGDQPDATYTLRAAPAPAQQQHAAHTPPQGDLHYQVAPPAPVPAQTWQIPSPPQLAPFGPEVLPIAMANTAPEAGAPNVQAAAAAPGYPASLYPQPQPHQAYAPALPAAPTLGTGYGSPAGAIPAALPAHTGAPHQPFAHVAVPAPAPYAQPLVPVQPAAAPAPSAADHAQHAPPPAPGPRRSSRAPEGMGSSVRMDDPQLRETMDRAHAERSELAYEYQRVLAPLVTIEPASAVAAPLAHVAIPAGAAATAMAPGAPQLFVHPSGVPASSPAGAASPTMYPQPPQIQAVVAAPDGSAAPDAFHRPAPYAPQAAAQG